MSAKKSVVKKKSIVKSEIATERKIKTIENLEERYLLFFNFPAAIQQKLPKLPPRKKMQREKINVS